MFFLATVYIVRKTAIPEPCLIGHESVKEVNYALLRYQNQNELRMLNSQYPQDIAQIYIHGEGWIKKGDLHDYLKNNPKTVMVNIRPYPYLIPAVSSRGEKYVKSTPDSWKHDDLMDLPRE